MSGQMETAAPRGPAASRSREEKVGVITAARGVRRPRSRRSRNACFPVLRLDSVASGVQPSTCCRRPNTKRSRPRCFRVRVQRTRCQGEEHGARGGRDGQRVCASRLARSRGSRPGEKLRVCQASRVDLRIDQRTRRIGCARGRRGEDALRASAGFSTRVAPRINGREPPLSFFPALCLPRPLFVARP